MQHFKLKAVITNIDQTRNLIQSLFHAKPRAQERLETDYIYQIVNPDKVTLIKMRENDAAEKANNRLTVITENIIGKTSGYTMADVHVEKMTPADFDKQKRSHGYPDYIVEKHRQIFESQIHSNLWFYIDRHVTLYHNSKRTEIRHHYLEMQARFDRAARSDNALRLLQHSKREMMIKDELIETRSYIEMIKP